MALDLDGVKNMNHVSRSGGGHMYACHIIGSGTKFLPMARTFS
jgi:hypothetical protein